MFQGILYQMLVIKGRQSVETLCINVTFCPDSLCTSWHILYQIVSLLLKLHSNPIKCSKVACNWYKMAFGCSSGANERCYKGRDTRKKSVPVQWNQCQTFHLLQILTNWHRINISEKLLALTYISHSIYLLPHSPHLFCHSLIYSLTSITHPVHIPNSLTHSLNHEHSQLSTRLVTCHIINSLTNVLARLLGQSLTHPQTHSLNHSFA